MPLPSLTDRIAARRARVQAAAPIATTPTPPPPRLRGLGDAVAVVAGPIGRALKLDSEKCGCNKRQEWLNSKFPFKKKEPGASV